MYIYYDENNYITGYGSEVEERSFYSETIPAEVANYLGCYYIADGTTVLDESRKEYIDRQRSAESEVQELTSWFAWYDQQAIQYQRSQRMGTEFDRDMAALDAEAVEKSQRINELRTILSTPYSEEE